MKMVIVVLFFVVFLAIGAGMLGSSLRAMWRSSAAGSWPTTPGTITHCELEQGRGSKGGVTYECKVAYTYAVNGRDYNGDRLAFGYGITNGDKTAKQVYERLRGAKQVLVRYDPANPATATLSSGVHRVIQMNFAVAILWLAMLAGVGCVLWLQYRPDDVLLRNLVTR